MPSYTFVSTANAFVLFGGVPVFIDIRPDTLNIDENLIESAITPKTKAIVVVHYAGVPCEMDKINAIAKKHNLFVIEDAAQGLGSFYKNKALGTLGDLAAFSFHETKNIISGEGGAIIINNSQFRQRAEIIREKGTNRSQFLRGEIDKYTWQDIGSSYLPSELIAAFLFNQLENIQIITQKRLSIWNTYFKLFKQYEEDGLIRCPIIQQHSEHNGHIFYLLIANHLDRHFILQKLKQKGIQATSHYEPLHSSPAGKKYGRPHGDLSNTTKISQSIIRLPMWVGLTISQQEFIAEQLFDILRVAQKEYA
jgi:dTDP-4-amino-4,6-dideoxygalactose transaminase